MAVIPLPGAFRRRRRRPRRDRGRSAAGWRWFSDATIDAASHFRDVAWRRVALELSASVVMIAVSRIDPGFALSPWMLIAGLIWLAIALRMTVLKVLDHHLGEPDGADGGGAGSQGGGAGAAPRD